MTTKGIIFDLDGTLINTLEDLTDSMNTVLAELGCEPIALDECRRFVGHGLRKFAEKSLGPEHAELTDLLVQRMAEHYRDHCLIKTAPYSGIEETVQTLAAKGIRLAILTNKNQTPAEITVRRFFSSYFEPIVGAADGREPKPDPQTTLNIIEWWGVAKDEVIFVGDSEADVHTAANASVRCIACQWGYRSGEQLRETGAKIIIQHPEQILEHTD